MMMICKSAATAVVSSGGSRKHRIVYLQSCISPHKPPSSHLCTHGRHPLHPSSDSTVSQSSVYFVRRDEVEGAEQPALITYDTL